MFFLYTAFLGLVQGIAEFLPISSSGHLSLLQNFFGLHSAEETNLFLDVLLHLGTLISIFIYYRRDVADMITEFFRGCKALVHPDPAEKEPPEMRRMVLLVIVGTLPLFVVLPVKKFVDGLYSNTIAIAIALLITGTLLFVSDRLAKGRKDVRSVTLLDIIVIGFAQGIATIPGLSRSGTTISVAMMRGCKREFAVRFSFLLSMPAVIGANLLTLADAIQTGIDWSLMPAYLLGVAVSAVSGYFAIGLVNMLSNKGKFGNFAYYCWGVGVLAIILSIVL